MDMFKATEKMSGEVVIDKWEVVCELDKRAWHVVPYEMAETPKPILAAVQVAIVSGDPKNKGTYTHYVREAADLVGIYLGGPF